MTPVLLALRSHLNAQRMLTSQILRITYPRTQVNTSLSHHSEYETILCLQESDAEECKGTRLGVAIDLAGRGLENSSLDPLSQAHHIHGAKNWNLPGDRHVEMQWGRPLSIKYYKCIPNSLYHIILLHRENKNTKISTFATWMKVWTPSPGRNV